LGGVPSPTSNHRSCWTCCEKLRSAGCTKRHGG
jgi:hypothetical protein